MKGKAGWVPPFKLAWGLLRRSTLTRLTPMNGFGLLLFFFARSDASFGRNESERIIQEKADKKGRNREDSDERPACATTLLLFFRVSIICRWDSKTKKAHRGDWSVGLHPKPPSPAARFPNRCCRDTCCKASSLPEPNSSRLILRFHVLL